MRMHVLRMYLALFLMFYKNSSLPIKKKKKKKERKKKKKHVKKKHL